MTARIGRAVWVVPGTTSDRHGSAWRRLRFAAGTLDGA